MLDKEPPASQDTTPDVTKLPPREFARAIGGPVTAAVMEKINNTPPTPPSAEEW